MSNVRIWIAVFVAPHQEVSVGERLAAAGYVPLLPMQQVEIRHARQTMLVDRPVFPRYLFVGVPENSSWYPIKVVPGVIGILSAGQQPRVVPHHTLALLREADEIGAFRQMAIEHGSPQLRAFVRRIVETLPGQRIGAVYDLSRKQIRRMSEVDDAVAA